MPNAASQQTGASDAGKPYTGALLVDAYLEATRAARAGDPEGLEAIDLFARDLDEIAMRPGETGFAARRIRSGFADYFNAAGDGDQRDPMDFIDSGSRKALESYLVDDGTVESRRRYDLLGIDRQPSYQDTDGKWYVDSGDSRIEIPVDQYLPMMDKLVAAQRGEMPMLGALTGPQGVPAVAKAADLAVHAITAATTNYKWAEIAPSIDVPTADPAFRFPVMPQISDNAQDSWARLNDPVQLRAMQDVLGMAASQGKLDLSTWDHFVRAAGFLVDFATVGKVGGMAAKGAGAAAGALGSRLPVAQFAARTAAAGERQMAVQGAEALTRPAIPVAFSTVRDFAGYQLVQDSLYGRVQSPSDAATSAMAGAKDGALMVGVGMFFGAVRTGLMAALSKKVVDPATNQLVRRFGAAGEMIGSIFDTARERPTMDRLVSRMRDLANEGKSLREALVGYGWTQQRAQTVEHMLDSAAVGIAFGAYHDAIEDPDWDKMSAEQKTARMISGLTSPAAIGGAAAFSLSAVAHSYANKVSWGKEWENAPPKVKAEFEQRVQNVVRGLSQPHNYELTDSFREAFDAYRARNPKDFEGVEFEPYWLQQLKLESAMALREERADLIGGQIGPQQFTTGEQPPPPEPPTPPSEPPGSPSTGPTPTSGAPAAPSTPPAEQSAPVSPRPQRPPPPSQPPAARRITITKADLTKPEDQRKWTALEKAGNVKGLEQFKRQLERKRKETERSRSRMEGRLAEINQGQHGFRAWLRAQGGLSLRRETAFAGELQGIAEGVTADELKKYPFLGPLVRGAKSTKGMTLEEAFQAARSAGFLRSGDRGEATKENEAGIRELLDLIANDTTRQSGERVYEQEMRSQAAELEQRARDEGYASAEEAFRAMEAEHDRAREEEEIGRIAERESYPEPSAKPTPEEEPFTLFSGAQPPYTRGQQNVPFPEGQPPAMSPEAQRTWLEAVQHTLYPFTDFRSSRSAEIAKSLVQTFRISVMEAEATAQLMEAHAEVWSKSTGKPIEQWYQEKIAGVTTTPPPLGAPEGARAAVTFLADGRAVLHALEKPRVSDVLHELGHIWRRDIQGDAKKALESWAGVRDGAWSPAAEEKFASAFERYMRLGRAPTEKLKSVFGEFAKWMKAIYQRIRGTGLDVRMDSDLRKAMDSLFELPPLDKDEVLRERMSKLDARTMGDIYRANRNKPQYVGLSLHEIVGHELRGGLDPIERTPAVKIAQAGDSFIQAFDIMRDHGLIPPATPYEHPVSNKVIIELANGGGAFRQEFEGRNASDAFNIAVEAAQRAKAQMREVHRELAGDEFRDKLGTLYEFMDATAGTDELTPEMRARFERVGLLKDGAIDRQMVASMGAMLEERMAREALSGATDTRLIRPTVAARPWIALGASPSEYREHALARSLKLKRLVDLYAKNKLPPSALRQLSKIGQVFGGMWQNSPLTSIVAATNRSAVVNVFMDREFGVRLMQSRADDALARIHAHFGGRVMPTSHAKLLREVIESGMMRNARGPEVFESLRPGTGYLFEIATEINDTLLSLGRDAVQAQFLAPGQLEKFGGAYVPHVYLQGQRDDAIKELREGRMPQFAARNLSRGDAPEGEVKLRIDDPFQWLTTVTRQEGRAVQWLGIVQDLHNGRYGITEAELRKADPYTQALYEPAVLDSRVHSPGLGNGPGLRNWDVMSDMLAKQLDPNNPAPKSKMLQETLRAYMGIDENGKPTADGPLYLPRQLLWELDALTAHTFNPPSVENALDAAAVMFEQATRGFRRGLTVGRPKHWVLNILNSIGTNHALDRLPAYDVATSMLMGHGYYAEAVKDLLGLLELSEAGNPQSKPADWTHQKWSRVKTLERAFKELNGSTFSAVGLESSVIADSLSAIVSPDAKTAALLDQIQAEGHDPAHASQLRKVVFDAARRYSGGMAEFDRKLHAMLGSHDPAERARAAANFSGMYQLWEMSFKWAATLRTLDTQPVGMSLKEAVRHAAVGTADYANTSPMMRSFNTAYSTLGNPLFSRTEGSAKWARAALREALKGRFWMYQSTMAPALAMSVGSHPVRAATVLAMTAGVTSVLHSLSTRDPEEEMAFQEALRGSLARSGSPVFDKDAIEILKRTGIGAPNVAGGGTMPDSSRSLMQRMWYGLLEGTPLMFQAPSRGDETRISDLTDVAPGWGNWISAYNGAANWTASSTGDKAQAVLDSMSMRGMELSIALAHGLFGAADALNKDATPATISDALKVVRNAAADIVPTMSPMWPLSREGQRFMEVAALNGQNIDEWARGVIQVDQPSQVANLGEFVFSSAWRSQRLLQPQLGGVTEREALDAIAGRLFPEVTPARGAYWDKLRSAQSDAHYQMSELLAGTYQEFLKWGRSTMTYDAMLVPALFNEDGPMQRFVASQTDPERKEMMGRYVERFVASDEFQRTLGPIMEIARRREMRPDYFRLAATTALRDPTGTALLNWLDKKVVREKLPASDVPDMAAIFFRGIEAPAPGSERYHQWSQILQRLYALGWSSNRVTDTAANALRRHNIKPELAGRPALQESLIER